MAKFLLPFLAFVAVMLIMMLAYWVWGSFFDRRSQAKKEHLQAVRNVVHYGGQNLIGSQYLLQDSPLETWLRSRSSKFVQLENLIKSAHSPLTALRVMGLMFALFSVVVVLGLLRQTDLPLLLVIAAAIASTPVLWLSQMATKRRQAFGEKLPDALDYITRSLRAGHSLTSAMGMVGKEFADPIGMEFKTVFDEVGFGIPFNDSLTQLAARVQSNDLNFFVISLMIQHETGGNLTELLDGLSKTIRDRFKLRGKIRTLSSEGRASGWILGSMPFVLAGILTLLNPGYMSVLWTSPQGQNLMLIGFGLMVVGFILLNRIIQIKV
jgi:tight adherence protein B